MEICRLLIEKTYAEAEVVAPKLLDMTRFGSLSKFAADIPAMLIGLVGIVFLGIFFLGGYQYLTAMGNEEQSTKAKSTLINAIIGLVIVLAAEALVLWIKSRL